MILEYTERWKAQKTKRDLNQVPFYNLTIFNCVWIVLTLCLNVIVLRSEKHVDFKITQQQYLFMKWTETSHINKKHWWIVNLLLMTFIKKYMWYTVILSSYLLLTHVKYYFLISSKIIQKYFNKEISNKSGL